MTKAPKGSKRVDDKYSGSPRTMSNQDLQLELEALRLGVRTTSDGMELWRREQLIKRELRRRAVEKAKRLSLTVDEIMEPVNQIKEGQRRREVMRSKRTRQSAKEKQKLAATWTDPNEGRTMSTFEVFSSYSSRDIQFSACSSRDIQEAIDFINRPALVGSEDFGCVEEDYEELVKREQEDAREDVKVNAFDEDRFKGID